MNNLIIFKIYKKYIYIFCKLNKNILYINIISDGINHVFV